jgi:hypothetical protein
VDRASNGKGTKTSVQYHARRPLCDPTVLSPKWIPDHLDRFEFLKACERLKIPHNQWPTFGGATVLLPGWYLRPPGSASAGKKVKNLGLAVEPLVLELPAFDLCDDDHRTWKRKADQAWWEFRKNQFGPYLKKCTKIRQFEVSRETLVPRKQKRFDGTRRSDSIPSEVRYELAVRRHCLGSSWASLHKPYEGVYTPDRIRKLVTEILSRLGLLGHPQA